MASSTPARRSSSSLLFDASALVNLVILRGQEALDLVKGNHILDLTLYEAGNAIWKLSTLQKKILPAEADSLFGAVVRMAREQASLVRVSEIDQLSVLGLAREERISYYDATYVYVARDNKLGLITDDTRLATVASKFVNVKASSDL